MFEIDGEVAVVRRRAAPRARVRAGVPVRRYGRGVALVEALMAILVFSLGILGVVGMQARSVQMLSEATLRTQAAQHASDLIAEMWTTDPAQRANLYSSSGSSPVRYESWKSKVQSGPLALPGADASPPVVVVNTVQTPYSIVGAGNSTASNVTITIFWSAPGSTHSNSYTTTAMILEPQS
jgi:type IV pilus assembly protein PilV